MKNEFDEKIAEMHSKFIKTEEKIKLVETIDEDEIVSHLNKIIYSYEEELKVADMTKNYKKDRLAQLDDEIKVSENELEKLKKNEDQAKGMGIDI
jgi:septal ring factor EnvC (AmiA/AmiB activator)